MKAQVFSRALFEKGQFVGEFAVAPLETYESCDRKGFYKNGCVDLLPNMTDVSGPYEPPLVPKIHPETAQFNIEGSAKEIRKFFASKMGCSSSSDAGRSDNS